MRGIVPNAGIRAHRLRRPMTPSPVREGGLRTVRPVFQCRTRCRTRRRYDAEPNAGHHMPFPDHELVMISAIEHYSYCPRQCGLIHVEHVFDENVFTLRGQAAHRRTHDEAQTAWEDGVRVERGLPLWSVRLGLTG